VNKLLLTATAGLSVLAAPLAASAEPWHHHDNDAGAALAAGVFGFVLGSALANSHPTYERSYGYDYDYGRYGYDYCYGYHHRYHQRCGWVNEPYRNYWGGVDYQQVYVCR